MKESAARRAATQALERVIEKHLPMATGSDWNAESMRAVVEAARALLGSEGAARG